MVCESLVLTSNVSPPILCPERSLETIIVPDWDRVPGMRKQPEPHRNGFNSECWTMERRIILTQETFDRQRFPLGLVRPWINFLGLSLSDGTEVIQRARSCWVSCCIIRQSRKDKPHGVLSPGARHDSPGKVIIKYFLTFFTMESRFNFHD